MTRLWAWFRCLTFGHDTRKIGEARSGVEVVMLYRCKRCWRVTETRYRTEQHFSDKGIHANRGS